MSVRVRGVHIRNRNLEQDLKIEKLFIQKIKEVSILEGGNNIMQRHKSMAEYDVFTTIVT